MQGSSRSTGAARRRQGKEALCRHKGRHPPDERGVRQLFKLFQGSKRDLEAVDVNALTLEVRDFLRGELDDHKVAVTTDLAPDLPAVHGHGA